MFHTKKLRAVILFLISALLSAGLSLHFAAINNSCGFVSPVLKAAKDTVADAAEYTVYLAKNEFESCQLIINSDGGEIKVEISEFKNSAGDVLASDIFEEKFIRCVSNRDYGEYPDALVPYYGGTLSADAGSAIPLYIRLHSTPETPGGDYSASVKVLSDGEEVFSAVLKAHVWDFVLPEKPSCKTAFGLHTPSIYSKYKGKDAAGIYGKFYEYLLEHRITPSWMTAHILSDEGSEQMSDSRRTSFIIPFNGDYADAAEQFAKVSSNPEWLEKSFFYAVDEPRSAADFGVIAALAKKFSELCPGYNMITPFYIESVNKNGEDISAISLLSGKSNILCPLSSMFSNEGFLEQIEKARADGSRIWWYVCCSPGEGYCNFFINQDGIRPRMLFWQQNRLGIEGLLYWESAYWLAEGAPWDNALTTPWTGNTTFGDGSLFYPGEDGPVSSFRLETISDGIEDFEYLVLAREHFGDEYAETMISKVTQSLTRYTKDSELFFEVRNEIGSALSQKLGTETAAETAEESINDTETSAAEEKAEEDKSPSRKIILSLAITILLAAAVAVYAIVRKKRADNGVKTKE